MLISIHLDPTDPNSPHKNLLLEILKLMDDKLQLIEAGVPYKLKLFDKNTQKKIKYSINFTHNILRRKRSNNKDGHRFEVFKKSADNLIGTGTDTEVYGIAKTIAILDGKIIYRVNEQNINVKNRVVKIEKIKPTVISILDENDKKSKLAKRNEALKKEFQLTKKVDYIHIKEPILIENITTLENYTEDEDDFEEYEIKIEGEKFTVMRKLPGVELLDILIKDRDESDNFKLTTKQRFKLTIALLNALKEQVHAKGLIHRDIKPENIRVDLTNPDEPIVYIYDFNLSKEKTDLKDKKKAGSIGYAAPEMYIHMEGADADESSDRYSMGRVIGLLWWANMQGTQVKPAKILYNETCNYNFPNLFNRISDISEPHKKSIKIILDEINSVEKWDRPPTNTTIRVFNNIFEAYQVEKIADEQQNKTLTAAPKNRLPIEKPKSEYFSEYRFFKNDYPHRCCSEADLLLNNVKALKI